MSTPPSASPRHWHGDAPIPTEIFDEVYRGIELRLETRPIGTLKAYETNPRDHGPAQIEVLSNSLRAFGFVAPVIVDENSVVIAGHGILLAAKNLGYTEVPVVPLSHLNEAEKKVLRIALNRAAELANWDFKLLAGEFERILEINTQLAVDLNLGLSAFTMPQIDGIFGNAEPGEGSDDLQQEPDLREPPVSRPGDKWQMEEHCIIAGDARDPGSYASLLGDERAAVGLHDAPYNVATKRISKSRRHPDFVFARGELSEEAYTAFLADFLSLVRAHSRPGAVQFSFIDFRHMGEMLQAGRAAGLNTVNVCIWDKGAGALGGLYRGQYEMCFVFSDPSAPVLNNVQLGKYGRNRTNVWKWPGALSLRKELQLHPTPKPVGLLAEAIRDVSNRGDIVLDCFSGSGSTIIAAAKTGRRARVIELDPHYVDVSVRRWETWSGGVARHSATGLTFDQLKEKRLAEGKDSDSAADSDAGPSPVRHRARPLKPVEAAP